MKSPTKSAGKSPAQLVSRPRPVTIKQLPSGVRGLDEILGGGLPEFSFSIIAGAPGCGKTTLAHQFVFANATVARPALYLTVLGEPAIKMLRYQQQYSFFDESKLNESVRFINLSEVVVKKAFDVVLEEISRLVREYNPAIVVVDSFRSIIRKMQGRADGEMDLQSFIQSLAVMLTSFQATTFLIGEYSVEEARNNPIFTVADCILWLSQQDERNSVVRKLQIVKLRGQGSVPGLHTIRIDSDGVQAFPRTLGFHPTNRPRTSVRLSMGIPELDKLLGGGLLQGDSMLITGPTGAGKSILATQFAAAGLRKKEAAIMVLFEERPKEYARRAATLGMDLVNPQKTGLLEVIYLRPLDLSVDETMQEILDAVERTKAKRLVIDSLVGFEMALAPGFRADFRESLYRMIGGLKGAGITIVSTVEIADNFTEFQFSRYAISFLTDDILRLRYVEIDGQLRRILVVVKMRGGNHSKDIREYVINDKGVLMIHPHRNEYAKLTTGLPERIEGQTEPAPARKAQ